MKIRKEDLRTDTGKWLMEGKAGLFGYYWAKAYPEYRRVQVGEEIPDQQARELGLLPWDFRKSIYE